MVCLLTSVGYGENTDYLASISGTYVELFPVLSQEAYRSDWLEATTPLVGEENAEAATDMLLSMCMAETYGDAAAEKYAADPDSMAFNCYFLGGVAKLPFPLSRDRRWRLSGRPAAANPHWASLACRFFDVGSGSVSIGGVDVRDIPKAELMDTVSFVFQNSRLLKGSILDNVKLGRPDATEDEVLSGIAGCTVHGYCRKAPRWHPYGDRQQGHSSLSGWRAAAHRHCARHAEKCADKLILDEATALCGSGQ